jgi:hypothetical protein
MSEMQILRKKILFSFLVLLLNCHLSIEGDNLANQGFLYYFSHLASSSSTNGANTPNTDNPVINPPSPTSNPISVVSTTPNDNAINISLLPASYSVTFSSSVKPTTVTTSTSGTTCSGSVQISDDDFTTCIPALAQPTTADNTTFTVNLSLPISFRADVIYKIKVTTAVTDLNGVAITSSYTTTNGFRTGTPCGHNCFFSSTSLTANAGPGSSSFLIQSGANSGKQLIIHGGVTSTTLYNFSDQSASVGPTLTTSVSNGSSNAFLSSGANAGKTLVIVGIGTAMQIFDPIANSFSVGTVSPVSVTSGSISFRIPSGPNAGKIFYVRSGSQRQWALYDPSTDSYYFVSPATDFSSNVGSGVFAFLIQSGANTGKYFIAHGSVNTDASIYDPVANNLTYVAGGASLAVNSDSKSFYITTGIQAGKNLLYYSGGSTTKLYDHSAGSIGAGPALPGNIGPGSNNFAITTGANAGKTLILQGGSNVSYLYDPTTNTFSAGPSLASGTISGDSHNFPANGGLYPTATYVVNGGASSTINIYFP